MKGVGFEGARLRRKIITSSESSFISEKFCTYVVFRMSEARKRNGYGGYGRYKYKVLEMAVNGKHSNEIKSDLTCTIYRVRWRRRSVLSATEFDEFSATRLEIEIYFWIERLEMREESMGFHEGPQWLACIDIFAYLYLPLRR